MKNIFKGVLWRDSLMITRYKFNLIFTLFNILLSFALLFVIVSLMDPEQYSKHAGTSNIIAFIFIGMLASNFQLVSFSMMPNKLTEELYNKQLEFLVSGPISIYQYLLAEGIGNAVLSGIISVPIYVFLLIIFEISLDFTHILISVFILLIFIFILIQLGIFICSFVLTFRNIRSMISVLASIFSIFAGTYFPVQVIPFPISLISLIIPTTIANDLLRFYLLGGTLILPVAIEWLILFIYLIIYTVAAKIFLDSALTRIKIEGISFI